MLEEETKLIQRTPPRCKSCRYPEKNSPKRIFFAYVNEFNDEIAVIRCPDLKCGNGWLIQYAVECIVFEKQDDITEEVVSLLKCKREDIQVGYPEAAPEPSPSRIVSAILNPLIIWQADPL